MKLGELEKYLQIFDEILPETKEEYLNDRIRKFASERALQLCIEVILDMCAMLIQHFRLGPPSDEENILDLLSNHIQNIDLIKEMKKFRNILVHRYGEIDDIRVYENAIQGRDDFTKILEEFRQLIDDVK